jgi:hypothetical protein
MIEELSGVMTVTPPQPLRRADLGSGILIAYLVSIFLGAFLLFSVQLLLGKFFLPWFGGTPATWTTCMFFFQVLLLGGYSYAHALTSWFSPRAQGLLHAVLLLAALALLVFLATLWRSPLTPSLDWRPHGSERPVWHLIVLLAVSVGLPYFALSSTGPLVQSWFSHTHPGRSPYRLYSLSNLASLLGLLSYPFLVEPWIPLRNQSRIWLVGFIAYVAVCGYCAMRARKIAWAKMNLPLSQPDLPKVKPSGGILLLWLGLAACASLMFLATTNQICQDIAVVPFLWVLPLSLYLVSFILCFDHPRWYSRAVFHPALVIAIFLASLLLGNWGIKSLLLQLAGYSFILFVVCMVCHGELARCKPSSRHLTLFYLMVSLGGTLGGALVALIFPHLFRGFWEYHLALWASVALLFAVLGREKASWLYCDPFGLPLIAMFASLLPGTVLMAIAGRNSAPSLFPVLLVMIAVYFLTRGGKQGFDQARAKAAPIYCVLALFIVGTVLFFLATNQVRGSVVSARNFYGVLTVREVGHNSPEQRAYALFHGHINHGFQFVSEARRPVPTGYYGVTSGIGLALTALHSGAASGGIPRGLRVGIVGLGAGTLAAYGRSGDYIRFYEINPEVTRIARGPYFSYLSNCAARVDVVPGDARLSMENELEHEQPRQFDLLALDAFSGDAIPLHLLTREAFEIYLRQVKPGGIIAVHITNTYFNLLPILNRVGEHFGLHYSLLHTDGDRDITSYSDWVVLTQDEKLLASLPASTGALRNSALRPDLPMWTDDYNNLLWVLR